MFVFGNQHVKEIKFWLCFERSLKKKSLFFKQN